MCELLHRDIGREREWCDLEMAISRPAQAAGPSAVDDQPEQKPSGEDRRWMAGFFGSAKLSASWVMSAESARLELWPPILRDGRCAPSSG